MFDLYLVFSMKDFLSLVVYGIQSHHVRAAARSRPVVHCHRYSWSHRFVAVRQNRSEHRGWSQDEYRNHGKIVTCNVSCNAFYWFSGCVIYVIVNPCTSGRFTYCSDSWACILNIWCFVLSTAFRNVDFLLRYKFRHQIKGDGKFGASVQTPREFTRWKFT